MHCGKEEGRDEGAEMRGWAEVGVGRGGGGQRWGWAEVGVRGVTGAGAKLHMKTNYRTISSICLKNVTHTLTHTRALTHTPTQKGGGGFTQRGGGGETCNSREFEIIFQEKLKVTK